MNPLTDVAANSVYLTINLTLLGSSIALSLAFAFSLTRMARPRLRYMVALVAFLASAVVPVTVSLREQQESSIPVVSVGSGAAIVSGSYDDNTAPTDLTFSSPRLVGLALIDQLNRWIHQIAGSQIAMIWLLFWPLASLLLVGREVVGHVRLAKARRRWEPAPVRLRYKLAWPNDVALYLDEREGPSTVGLIQPAVVLSYRMVAELPLEAVQRIARHELAHARWRDPLVNAALRLVRAALWPSLPLWFLFRIVHVEREAAADRAALNTIESSVDTSQAAVDYASSLVLIARWSRYGGYPMWKTQLGGITGLDVRVRRLLQRSTRLTGPRLAFAILTLLAGLWGVTVLPVTPSSFKSTAAVLAQTRLDKTEGEIQIAADAPIDNDQTDEPMSGTGNMARKAIRRGTPEVSPSTVTASVVDDNRDNQESADLSKTMGQDQRNTARCRDECMRVVAKVDREPDRELVGDNSNNSPLIIGQALVKQVTREECLHLTEAHPDYDVISDQYVTLPRISLTNISSRRITGFALAFRLRGQSRVGPMVGEKVSLDAGASFMYRAKWTGVNVFIPGSANDVTVFVVGVEYEDGSTWGDFPLELRTYLKTFQTGA